MPMLLLTVVLTACTGSGETGPAAQPAGQPQTATTTVLEAGAVALQRDAPPDALDIYLIGFHPIRNNPRHQTEAHHFCRQVNEDFAQCALFDGNTADANLTGIEYIISEELFATLPKAEKQYWHPHNGEILSGQLVAPGLPQVAEKELMRSKMNSYGKTWHTWNTSHGGVAGDLLPLGQPVLAWSFSRFGEADPALVAGRDQRMGIDLSSCGSSVRTLCRSPVRKRSRRPGRRLRPPHPAYSGRRRSKQRALGSFVRKRFALPVRCRRSRIVSRFAEGRRLDVSATRRKREWTTCTATTSRTSRKA